MPNCLSKQLNHFTFSSSIYEVYNFSTFLFTLVIASLFNFNHLSGYLIVDFICNSLMTNDWRRKWQPTPVFLPGESQGRGSLVGCRLWGCTESDMTEATQQQQQQQQRLMILNTFGAVISHLSVFFEIKPVQNLCLFL